MERDSLFIQRINILNELGFHIAMHKHIIYSNTMGPSIDEAHAHRQIRTRFV